MAARHPGPRVVVVDPASVVIRRPTPWFVTDPRPAIGRTPRPMTVAVRRPVAERVDHARVRLPDPTVIAGLRPVAVVAEVFGAPNIFVEVLIFIAKASC